MSIFCGNCGAELPDDAQFCTNCGHSVPAKSAESEGTETVNAAVETDAAAEPTAAAPASPTDSASQPAAAPSSAETAAAPSSAETAPVQNNKNLIPIIIGGAAAAVLLIVLIVSISLGGGGYKKAINNYFDVMFRGKADKIEKLCPPKYWDWYEDEYNEELDDIKDEYKDNWEDMLEKFEDEYGKNFKATYKITDKKELSDKKLKTIQDNLKERYDIAKKSVKKAYKLDLDVELKGKDDEDSNELTVYAVKIGGNWYLCNEDGYFLSAGY